MHDRTGLSYKLMGIVNLTDNSFLSSSRLGNAGTDKILNTVAVMLEDGADIIDIGACSTAPGNAPVSAEDEWTRLGSRLEELFRAFPDTMFSIDTFYPGTVKKVLGISGRLKHPFIVNDTSAGRIITRDNSLSDKASGMLEVIACEKLPYIAMDRSDDPYAFFRTFAGIMDRLEVSNWILDPGFGFGKTMEQNWKILGSLERFKDFEKPVLAALSRKRMIYQPLGLAPDTCSGQSVYAEKLAARKGADIIRTHDIKLHFETE